MTTKLVSEVCHDWHLYIMSIVPEEQEIMDLEAMATIISNSTCHTVTADGLIVAIIGFYELWPGVIEVFVVPSIHVPRYGKSFVKLVKSLLNGLFRDLPIHRMQTASRATPKIDRWMQALGFTCEGTMVGYSPGRTDYRMWARWD